MGYLRTSSVTALLGTIIAQLFFLQGQDGGFGYTTVGRPLAAACFAISIVTLLLGAYRTWRHQRAVLHGRVLVRGFETLCVGLMFFSVRFLCKLVSLASSGRSVALADGFSPKLTAVLFGLLLAIDIGQESAHDD